MRFQQPASLQQGRSLIELMIALAIGVVILGSIMLTTSGSTFNGQQSNAQSRINEDAQLVLAILNSQLKMAGYSTLITTGMNGVVNRRFDGPAVRGCDNGFSDTAAAAWSGAMPPVSVGAVLSYSDTLACAAGSGPAAFSVLYEADALNTPAHATGTGTDCLGQALAPVTSSLAANNAAIPTVTIAENRYYLGSRTSDGRWTLYCAGNGINNTGNFTPQPLIDNIESMTVTYGVGTALNPPNGSTTMTAFGTETTRYLTAAQIDADLNLKANPDQDRWKSVTSIRLCVTLKSEKQELEAVTQHRNCAGTLSNDRYIRKTITTTVALRNTL